MDGDERVIAAAQQIVKSLGTSKNVTEDMILILSNFDNRLSTITDLLSNTAVGAPRAGAKRQKTEAEERLEAAGKVILRWDSPAAGPLPWDDSPDETAEYLDAVDEILALTEADGDDYDGDEVGLDGEHLDRAESLLQIAMARLEDEFRLVMARNTVPLDADRLHVSIRKNASLSFAASAFDEDFDTSAAAGPEEQDRLQDEGSARSRTVRRSRGQSLSGDFFVDLVRPEAVEDLSQISERMIRAKYEKECCQVYGSVRREVLDECLSVLGIERMSIEEVQRIEWRMLDDKMKKWIQATKLVVRVLLTAEKQLCDRIFGEAELIKEVCFTETAKGCVIQLLNFGEAISIGQRSPEKLFRILDMYDVLLDALHDLQALFPEDCRDFICSEAEGILKGLGDAAKGTFNEFENAVRRETSRKPMQGGEIHPLTRYVMNYASLLVDYSGTLNSLLDDDGNDVDDNTHEEDDRYSGSMTPFGRRMRLMISYLETNLEEKSKLYEDGGMQYVFLMNNILYIVQKVKDSELRTLLGDQWVRKRRGKIRQYATGYLRASWTKVLSFLKDDGIGGGGSASSVSKVALKERFKNFNLAYEEIYRTQSTWKVPDPQLREELRISISEKVIPAYRSFMGRFGSHLDSGRHAGKYIKYTPEDLENHLSDLFEGLPGLASHPRRKLSS